MAAPQQAHHKGNHPRCQHACNDCVFEIDGGSGTPVIATNGNREGTLDVAQGTATGGGLTDTGTGDHLCFLNTAYHDIVITGVHVEGAEEECRAVYDSTAHTIQLLVYTRGTDTAADTAGIISVKFRGYTNSAGT